MHCYTKGKKSVGTDLILKKLFNSFYFDNHEKHKLAHPEYSLEQFCNYVGYT